MQESGKLWCRCTFARCYHVLKRQSYRWLSCRIWSQTRAYLAQCLSFLPSDFGPPVGKRGLDGTTADLWRAFLLLQLIPDQPILNFCGAALVGPAGPGRPVSSWFGRRAAMCFGNMVTIVAPQCGFSCWNNCFVIQMVWRSFTSVPVARIQTLDNFILARLSRMMESTLFICGASPHQAPKRFGRMAWCSHHHGPRVARCWGTCRRMKCAFRKFPMYKLWIPQLVIKFWSA